MSADRFYIVQAGDNTRETGAGPISEAAATRRVQQEPELKIVTAEQLNTVRNRPVWPNAADDVLGKNDEGYKHLAKGDEGDDRA